MSNPSPSDQASNPAPAPPSGPQTPQAQEVSLRRVFLQTNFQLLSVVVGVLEVVLKGSEFAVLLVTKVVEGTAEYQNQLLVSGTQIRGAGTTNAGVSGGSEDDSGAAERREVRARINRVMAWARDGGEDLEGNSEERRRVLAGSSQAQVAPESPRDAGESEDLSKGSESESETVASETADTPAKTIETPSKTVETPTKTTPTASGSDDGDADAEDEEDLVCPLSLQRFTDPVVLTSGQTYEREWISRYLYTSYRDDPRRVLKDPLSNKPLKSSVGIVNWAVRKRIGAGNRGLSAGEECECLVSRGAQLSAEDAKAEASDSEVQPSPPEEGSVPVDPVPTDPVYTSLNRMRLVYGRHVLSFLDEVVYPVLGKLLPELFGDNELRGRAPGQAPRQNISGSGQSAIPLPGVSGEESGPGCSPKGVVIIFSLALYLGGIIGGSWAASTSGFGANSSGGSSSFIVSENTPSRKKGGMKGFFSGKSITSRSGNVELEKVDEANKVASEVKSDAETNLLLDPKNPLVRIETWLSYVSGVSHLDREYYHGGSVEGKENGLTVNWDFRAVGEVLGELGGLLLEESLNEPAAESEVEVATNATTTTSNSTSTEESLKLQTRVLKLSLTLLEDLSPSVSKPVSAADLTGVRAYVEGVCGGSLLASLERRRWAVRVGSGSGELASLGQMCEKMRGKFVVDPVPERSPSKNFLAPRRSVRAMKEEL